MARKTVEQMKIQQRTIFDMYIAGSTILDIARHTGLEYRSVQSNLKLAISAIDVTADLEREMTRDIGRLERLFKAYWPTAIGEGGPDDGEKNADHADLIIKILDRKAKLLGLDAAKRVDIYMIIERFALKHGLDPADVVDVVQDLLPAPVDK